MCVHFPRSVTRADLSCCHSVVFHICISGLSINYSEKSYSMVALFNFLENSGANVCQNSTLHIWYVKFTELKLSKHAHFFFIPVKVQGPQHLFAKGGSVGSECVLPTPWLHEVWKLLVSWCAVICFGSHSKFVFFFFFSSWLQIDLEPEGRVYVIIDLSGSSGEGRDFKCFILLFHEWNLQGSLQWKY